jgi:hypothetical protein
MLTVAGSTVTVTDVLLPTTVVALSAVSAICVGHLIEDGSITIPKLATGTYRVIGIASDDSVTNSDDYTVTNTLATKGHLPHSTGKWCYASIVQYLKQKLSAHTLVLDELRRTPELAQWIELRVDGPNTKQLDNHWKCVFEVNLLLSARVDGTNLYAFREFMDSVTEAMPSCIEVYKYGSLAEDTNAYVGCLERIIGKRDTLQTGYLGRKANADIEQACIEDHYEITIEEA